MDNAAHRLLQIYQAWKESYGPTAEAQAARNILERGGVGTHTLVFELLGKIDAALYRMGETRPERVRIYRARFDGWVRMALNYPGAWTGQSNGEDVFPSHSLEILETFAEMLEYEQPPLPESSVALLRSVINDALALLADDASLSQPLRDYMYRILDELRRALDGELIMDNFEYRQAARNLWITLKAASADSSSHRSRWSDTATRMSQDVVTGALASIPSLGLTAYQIASGSGS